MILLCLFFFFFQAEDGIRVIGVTGVQTCALPIWRYTADVFPISDVIPSRTRPVVTISLIALNALAFLYELQLSDRQLQVFAYAYGVVPAVFSWSDVLSSMFLHDGWMHFLGSMLYLWIFGDNVEDRLGHGGFVLFYVFCGAVAATAQTLVHPYSTIPMIGASGAIAGVMGAYF